MLNKVMLIGNVGKDPEVRHLESGIAVASLTLATSERFKDRNTGELREQTEWHQVVLWRQLADLAERFIRKGTQIYVEGALRSRSYEDQTGQKRYVTEVVAQTVQLLGKRGDTPIAPLAPNPANNYRPNAPVQAQNPAPQQAPIRPQPQAPTPPATQGAATDVTAPEAPFILDTDADDLPF